MQYDASTPRTEITIQSQTFTLPQPFTAGHPLTEGEASQMNQLLAENVRNNFAGKIKAQADKPEAERKEFTQADLDAYVTEYEFGVRRAGNGEARLTPVEREARRIARDTISAKLKELGKKVDKDTMENLVSTLAAKDHVVKEAEKRVKATAKISLDELGLDLGGAEPQAAAA
jgi:hypothetical protein